MKPDPRLAIVYARLRTRGACGMKELARAQASASKWRERPDPEKAMECVRQLIVEGRIRYSGRGTFNGKSWFGGFTCHE